jgi:hypothetical protein
MPVHQVIAYSSGVFRVALGENTCPPLSTLFCRYLCRALQQTDGTTSSMPDCNKLILFGF